MTKQINLSVEELKQVIDKRVTQHEQFVSKSLDEILATQKKILVLLEGNRPTEQQLKQSFAHACQHNLSHEEMAKQLCGIFGCRSV